MTFRRLLSILVFAFATLATAMPICAEDWLPITKADLELKEVPQSPGASAVILYRSVEHDDARGFEEHYVRIKILTQQGTKYGNVEIPAYVADQSMITEIKARTIEPDGRVVPFTGRVFEKVVVKKNSFKELANAFSMPEVGIGSIVEYRYTERFDTETGIEKGTTWQVQDELFTKRARFRFRQGPELALRWVYMHLGTGIAPVKQGDGSILLEMKDVLPFQREPFMPPETEVRGQVYFFYVATDMPDSVEEYWKKKGKDWKKESEKFIGSSSAVAVEVRQLLRTEDSTPESKMRRLYARVQQVRNLTWDGSKTQQEEDEERLKPNANVEDVLKHGYGDHFEINKLYVALLRTAGVEASLMRIAERSESFLHKNVPRWDEQLTWEIVVASDGEKEYYLDPGTLFCPFGQLSWEHTLVEGWRMDTMTWAKVPAPAPDSTVESHEASLQLHEDGILTGTLQVSYTGMAALSRRLSLREDDDSDRKTTLEDEVKGWLPAGAEVDVLSMGGWTTPEAPLIVKFRVMIKGLGQNTGKRLILPVALFGGQSRSPFQYARRTHPVYFHYAFHESDGISLILPHGFELATAMIPKQVTASFAMYSVRLRQEGNTLRISRDLEISKLLFGAEEYPKLQSFYNDVRAGDNDQVVLKAEAGPATE